MIPASVMMKLATIGLSTEQAAAVASMLSEVEAATKIESEAVVEKSRSKARERVQRWREKNNGNVTERNETQRNGLRAGDARGDVKQINIDTSKEEKKDKSAAKPLSDLAGFKAELEQVLSPERVEAIVDLRRKKKAPLTPHAGKLLVKALSACPDIGAAADEMVIRNWTGIKPEWLSSRQSQAPPLTPHQQRHQAAIDAFDRRLGVKRDDEFTGNTLDLERADFGHH